MKNKLFGRIAVLTIAAAMSVALFTGCGSKVNDKDDRGRTVISIGNWPATEGTQLTNMNNQKERFEAANTDVVIEPDYWTFDRQTFYAKAAGGKLPTYFNVAFTEIPEIISSEYSADLTEALKKYGFYDNLNKDILDILSDDKGNVKAVPSSCYILGLAYNTEMFKAAGLTEADGTPKQPKDWDELAEFAVKIKEATGKPGVIFPTSDKVGGWIFTPVAWSYGVDFMEKDKDGKWQATIDTQEAVDALQYIKDLKWKYDVLPANTLVNGTEYYQTFATGGAAMCITAGDVPAKVVQYGMNPEQYGMMAMPAGPKRHVTLLGGAVRCVNEDATEDQIDAAVRWHKTSYDFELTDEYKTNVLATMETSIENNQQIGIKNMSIWSENSEALAWYNNLIDEKINTNPNYVKLYNDFVKNCTAEIQAEEPVCAQELYAILDGCIQEVLQNKDADCAALIKNANNDFQKNYLDNLTY